MKTALELIDELKIKTRKLGKSNISVGDRFAVTLSRGNKQMSLKYHACSDNSVELYDVVMCLVLDALYAENATSYDDFLSEFDLRDNEQSFRTFNELHANTDALYEMFTQDELNTLKEEAEQNW